MVWGCGAGCKDGVCGVKGILVVLVVGGVGVKGM